MRLLREEVNEINIKKFIQYLIGLLLGVIAVLIATMLLRPVMTEQPKALLIASVAAIGLVAAAIGVFLGPPVERGFEKLSQRLVSRAAAMNVWEIVCCAVGLIIGLVIASLVGTAVARIGAIGTYLALLLMIFFGYAGLLIGYRMRTDFANAVQKMRRDDDKAGHDDRDKAERRDPRNKREKVTPKVLDTSVIIDGRIADIYQTGFLEGDLVVAGFVLEELRHIADSSDTLKRQRGRGGLDCLNRMRQEFTGHIIISNKDYPDVEEVDEKLLRLAQDIHGLVVTNDYNLNKVAQLRNISVLNINDLANAVKPVALPGEEMIALVVKEGKEINQGVAYLEDGTMLVVENGRRYIGRRIYVVVTSILQTSAGRMIFVRPKYGKNGEPIDAPEEKERA